MCRVHIPGPLPGMAAAPPVPGMAAAPPVPGMAAAGPDALPAVALAPGTGSCCALLAAHISLHLLS